ncbi:hypothetical protein K439DRAFT_1663915 [Ramaria rubella]|nr:hypothetical protein K439DRAFT_1663915 [Ramaria rubella]
MGKRLEMEKLRSWFYKALGEPSFDTRARFEEIKRMPQTPFPTPSTCSRSNSANISNASATSALSLKQIRAGTLRTDRTGGVDMFASAQNSGNAFINKFLTPSNRRPRIHDNVSIAIVLLAQTRSRSRYRTESAAYENSLRLTKVDLVAVGGIIGALPKTDAVTLLPTDFGTRDTPRTDRERGTGLFRVVKALLDPPVVVGPVPQKATETKFKTIELRMLGAEKTKLFKSVSAGDD